MPAKKHIHADDTEEFLWSLRDVRAGIVPRQTQFIHNEITYIAIFKRKNNHINITINNNKTKTSQSCDILVEDFYWAEDLLNYILKTYCD